MDDNRLLELLEQHKGKSFVKRILTPDKYPSLDLGQGRKASHLMSWIEAGGRYFAYPTVLYDGKGGLTRHDPRKAWEQVRQTGNFIEFDTPEEADWFSKNYKRYWKMGK